MDATVDRVEENKALQAHSLKRMDEEADEGRTMKEIESVLQCDDLWKDFLDTCDDVEAEEEVDEKTLTLMTGAIGARLFFDSVQRPGAVVIADLFRRENVPGSVNVPPLHERAHFWFDFKWFFRGLQRSMSSPIN